MSEARIDVQVEHKHAPPPAETEAPEHLPEVRVALPRRRARGARSGCAATAATTSRCAPGRGSTGTPTPARSSRRRPTSAPTIRSSSSTCARTPSGSPRPSSTPASARRSSIGQATIDGHPVELAVMDFSFMGGSMGSAVGEKFSRACDSAIERGVPLDRRHELGRRAHAGRDPLADAAAEDGRARSRTCTTPRLPMLTVMAHPTTAGVLALVRVARRRDDRRAWRADRVHRPARRPADDAREAARGLRPRRAEPALRPPRRDRAATRAARVPGAAAAARSR